MTRIAMWLVLAAIVAGVAGFATTAGTASAADVNLDCEVGEVVDGVGTVTCNLDITDLPSPLDDFALQLEATYNDVDGDGAPSAGDQLKCITVTGQSQGGPIEASFCR